MDGAGQAKPGNLLGDLLSKPTRLLQKDSRRRKRGQALLPRRMEGRGKTVVRPRNIQARDRNHDRRYYAIVGRETCRDGTFLRRRGVFGASDFRCRRRSLIARNVLPFLWTARV